MFDNFAIKIKFFVSFFLLFSGVYAQETLKLGGSSLAVNNKAALDVESTTRGFLPPRMTKLQRNAITSPPQALLVWCTDCNLSTDPASGQFCVYMGAGWVPLKMSTTSIVTTQKKADANKPTRTSATAAKINGNLVEVIGAVPSETGVVYRPIVGNDFSTLPFLDGTTGAATSPNAKLATGSPVTKDGDPISVDVSGLGATPYYFRTYAKSFLGIGYGNTVIFNSAAPSFSTPVVTDGTTLYPKFSGTMTVNAGTPLGAVTEYGYCIGTSSSPTDKVKISDNSSIAGIDASLNGETFTANPSINLAVNDYDLKSIATMYFRFYVVANNVTTYSPEVTFTPVGDTSTGGTAIIKVKSVVADNSVFKIEESGSKTFTVTYDVTKKGTHTGMWVVGNSGATTGLSINGGLAAGSFNDVATNQVFTFVISGTPMSSLEGVTWTGKFDIGKLSSGAIVKGDITATRARCNTDLYNETSVVTITASNGRVWMDRNLGAFRQAVTMDDTEAYGCLFQMGRRGTDGHADINRTSKAGGMAVNSTTTTRVVGTIAPNSLFVNTGKDWTNQDYSSLWLGIGATNNPCPSGFRVPTEAETSAIIDIYGYSGMMQTLKFTLTGERDYYTGNVGNGGIGGGGRYWTSIAGGSSTAASFLLNDYVVKAVKNLALNKNEGFSVRCIKD